MAVVDFRSGGFQGAQPQRHAHDFPYGNAQEDEDENWHSDAWDEGRYAEAHPGTAAQPPSLLGHLSRLTHYLGALVSVGLMVILAVWGFKLVVRDVSGVPVIRAVQGEARTTPENPGGELTDRVGLAVNSVAAGAATAAPEKVAIAPAPVTLDAEDVPMGELGATAQDARPVDLPLLDDTPRVIAMPDGEAAAAAAAAAAVESTVEPEDVAAATTPDVPPTEAPVNEALTDLAGREPQDLAINQALIEANAQPPQAAASVAQSGRPAPRPRRVAAAVQAEPAPAPAAERPQPAAAKAAPEPAPAKVATGSAMVQIGAFDSDALAKGEWERVSGKFGTLFSGKSRVVQEAQSGGRTFWRLRAGGFASKDEARKFCASLIAQGVDCIPATAK